MAVQSTQNSIIDIAFRYAKVVMTNFNITNAYLFGSMVNGEANDESDIDIAIISDDFTGDIAEDTFMLMKLRRSIDLRIEPHPFMQKDFISSNPFAQEIISTGISLI